MTNKTTLMHLFKSRSFKLVIIAFVATAIWIHGSIYRNTFDPLNPFDNLLKVEDDDCIDSQFTLDVRLSNDITYVLVMTTYEPKETGSFSIVALGNDKILLDRLGKCRYACIRRKYTKFRAFDIETLSNKRVIPWYL